MELKKEVEETSEKPSCVIPLASEARKKLNEEINKSSLIKDIKMAIEEGIKNLTGISKVKVDRQYREVAIKILEEHGYKIREIPTGEAFSPIVQFEITA